MDRDSLLRAAQGGTSCLVNLRRRKSSESLPPADRDPPQRRVEPADRAGARLEHRLSHADSRREGRAPGWLTSCRSARSSGFPWGISLPRSFRLLQRPGPTVTWLAGWPSFFKAGEGARPGNLAARASRADRSTGGFAQTTERERRNDRRSSALRFLSLRTVARGASPPAFLADCPDGHLNRDLHESLFSVKCRPGSQEMRILL